MGITTRAAIDTVPFLRGGAPLTIYGTINQDGGRSGDMLNGTLMGRLAITGKWVPLAPAATDGSQFPRGILARTLLEADIQAGEIPDVPIIKGGSPPIIVASDQLIVETGDINTVVNQPAQINSRVEDLMIWANMYVLDNQDIERLQSP
jgi:hypothetical protein